MLTYALIFFIVALVAALFGFSSISSGSMAIARFLFFVFVVLFVLTLVFHLLGIDFDFMEYFSSLINRLT